MPVDQTITLFPPGHYHSPLLDLRSLRDECGVPFDGPEMWEFVDLRTADQRAYYRFLFQEFPILEFPVEAGDGFHFYSNNNFFPLSDALTLSALIQHERPRQIIEIGAGFSSAVMLDTLKRVQRSVRLTFVEPAPERLESVLPHSDQPTWSVIRQRVQQVRMSLFENLDPGDILFIDSSHVAKIGSDVAVLFLRILPRLKPGVLVHFHDIFYPMSYPMVWIREGRAWNESLFLRAFLIGNPAFQIVAFNSYAAMTFPEALGDARRAFEENSGGSLWLRKVSDGEGGKIIAEG